MKKSLVLKSFVCSLSIICIAYWMTQRAPQSNLPETPLAAFGAVTQALIKQDIHTLSNLSDSNVMESFEYWQGEQVTELYTYDFLVSKGAQPLVLKQPWGLWKEWAKRINLQKAKVVPVVTGDHTVVVITGQSDGTEFTFHKSPSGWILSKIGVTSGVNWNNNWQKDEKK